MSVRRREYGDGLNRYPKGERGVALAMVVWFLAAMSLLVMGIVDRARVDVHMAQIHVARAKAAAAGDGAIALMMLQLRTAGGERAAPLAGTFRLGDERVRVEVTPAEGLPDLFALPEPMLAHMLSTIGNLEAPEAQQLASSVVQLRSTSGRSGRFEALEDVLKISGFNRALLDDLRDYVRAIPGGSGRFDLAQAPPGLADRLREVAPEQYSARLQRQGRDAGDDINGVAVGSGLFRVDALIEYGGRTWLRRRWVDAGLVGMESNLPWRVVRSEAPRVVKTRHAEGVD